MAIWYVDHINGSSGNAGTSWASPKDKIASITASAINAGDEIRLAQTGNKESMGINATALADSRTRVGYIPFTSASYASPVLITTPAAHGLADGDIVHCASSTNLGSRGIFKVQVVSSTTLYLVNSVGTSAGGTGTLYKVNGAVLDIPDFQRFAVPRFSPSYWVAGTSVTITYQNIGTSRMGSSCSFSGTLTGPKKLAYTTLGSTADLSGFSICNIAYRSTKAIPTGDYRIALCSDSTGDTPVAYISVPTYRYVNSTYISKLSVDYGGALPSGINSIAIYSNVTTPNTYIYFENIFFTKDPSVHADGYSFSYGLLNYATGIPYDIVGFTNDSQLAILDGFDKGYHPYAINFEHYYTGTFTLGRVKILDWFNSSTLYDSLVVSSITGNGRISISGGWNTSTGLKTGISAYSSYSDNYGVIVFSGSSSSKMADVSDIYCYRGYAVLRTSISGGDMALSRLFSAGSYSGVNLNARRYTLTDCYFANCYNGIYSTQDINVIFDGTIFASCYYAIYTYYNADISCSGSSLEVFSCYFFLFTSTFNDVSRLFFSTNSISIFCEEFASNLNKWFDFTCENLVIIAAAPILHLENAVVNAGSITIQPTRTSAYIYFGKSPDNKVASITFDHSYMTSYQTYVYCYGFLNVGVYEVINESIVSNVYASGVGSSVLFKKSDVYYLKSPTGNTLSPNASFIHSTSDFSWYGMGTYKVGRYYARQGETVTFFLWGYPVSSDDPITLRVNNEQVTGSSDLSMSSSVMGAWNKLELTFTALVDGLCEFYVDISTQSYIDDIQGAKSKFPITDALWVGNQGTPPGSVGGESSHVFIT